MPLTAMVALASDKLTVTVADRNGVTHKIAPSAITEIVEPGNPDEFFYWDYFGE